MVSILTSASSVEPRDASGGKRASESTPPRTLGLTGLVGLTFFCVAGGAYGLEDAVGAGGPMIALLALLIVPWLWSFPTALMTAELSSAMPEDGGYVVWVERRLRQVLGIPGGMAELALQLRR